MGRKRRWRRKRGSDRWSLHGRSGAVPELPCKRADSARATEGCVEGRSKLNELSLKIMNEGTRALQRSGQELEDVVEVVSGVEADSSS